MVSGSRERDAKAPCFFFYQEREAEGKFPAVDDLQDGAVRGAPCIVSGLITANDADVSREGTLPCIIFAGPDRA